MTEEISKRRRGEWIHQEGGGTRGVEATWRKEPGMELETNGDVAGGKCFNGKTGWSKRRKLARQSETNQCAKPTRRGRCWEVNRRCKTHKCRSAPSSFGGQHATKNLDEQWMAVVESHLKSGRGGAEAKARKGNTAREVACKRKQEDAANRVGLAWERQNGGGRRGPGGGATVKRRDEDGGKESQRQRSDGERTPKLRNYEMPIAKQRACSGLGRPLGWKNPLDVKREPSAAIYRLLRASMCDVVETRRPDSEEGEKGGSEVQQVSDDSRADCD